MKVTVDMIEEAQLRKNLPDFRVGDQVKVVLKIVEGGNERLQTFEGTVIRMRGHGLSKSFTVRKISFGIGVERTLPYHSPRIDKIEIVRSVHVRRAKLYFLRDRSGRAARLDEKVDRRTQPAAKAEVSAPKPVAAAEATVRP